MFLQIPSWETITGPSPINWCESDFDYVGYPFGRYFAEYHNTITNVAYILSAYYLFRFWYDRKANITKIQSGIFLYFIFALFLTGIFSGIFHATLIWGAQKLDEIFENCAVIALLHVGNISERNFVKKLTNIVLHSIGCGFGIWCIPKLFCEIHLLVIVLITVYRYASITSEPKKSKKKKNQTIIISHVNTDINDTELAVEERQRVYTAAKYAGIGFFFWLCDFIACEEFRLFYLHAYGWHLCTAKALYEAGLVLYYLLLTDVNKK